MGENECVHPGGMFPSLLIGAGADKYQQLLQIQKTQWRTCMLIVTFATED